MATRRSPPGDPTRAVALIRASTDEPKLVLEAQRIAIARWANSNGAEVVSLCLEQGASGATPVDQRATLLEALVELKRVGAGLLIVAARDRLAKDAMIVAMIERLVERHGARVVSADGSNDVASPEGAIMRGMIDLFAQYERLLIGFQTRSALATKRARGERTGQVPFGFAVGEDGRSLAAQPDETKVIQAIWAMRAEGMSIRKIVEECGNRAFRSRSGKTLAKTQVERILRSPTRPLGVELPSKSINTGQMDRLTA